MLDITYKTSDGQVYRNMDAKPIVDLDSLPWPAYNLFRMDRYTNLQPATDHVDGARSFSIMTSRGCPIRPGATGKPLPGYRACVLDDEGRPLPPGSTGRLAVTGPTGCRYLDDPRQREYVQGGGNVTGDIYRVDEDGYFWYVARADDMIVSAGYNIAGPEVECALLAHPAVLECAVIGAPDPERGTVVKACIVLVAGRTGDAALTRQLQDFVKQRIAPYKYPRLIEYVGSLPRTASGKLQRKSLRGAGS